MGTARQGHDGRHGQVQVYELCVAFGIQGTQYSGVLNRYLGWGADHEVV